MAPKKKQRATPSTPKPRPSAFVADAPCEHCGCEWQGQTVNLDSGEMGVSCANPYCGIIQQLFAMLTAVSKLAADTPQFDNPTHVAAAKRVRDAVLAGKVRVGASGNRPAPNHPSPART